MVSAAQTKAAAAAAAADDEVAAAQRAEAKKQQRKQQGGLFGNLAGMAQGKFIGGLSPHIDEDKAPGFSPFAKPTLWSWISSTPFVLSHTPNTVWAIIAIAFYLAFPYDLSATGAAARGPFTADFFADRFPKWFALVFGYTSFWHVALYGLGCARRPFLPKRIYSLDKVAHNIFWSTSGVAIWVLFENVFCYLWASARLPYVTDAESFGTTAGRLQFLAVLALTPVWRDMHFYFAHRMIHCECLEGGAATVAVVAAAALTVVCSVARPVTRAGALSTRVADHSPPPFFSTAPAVKPLYMQVHSLHHRNTDIEPFAGLCMHVIEHLYYYACILPRLVFRCSPFAFLWNGVHLLLAPGASHSGWEDHFQADAFHYAHHRYFECNYAGLGAAFLDVAFGTFVASFGEKETPDKISEREDAKSTLRAVPTFEFLTYLTLSCGCLYAWAHFALGVAAGTLAVTETERLALAALAGFGPVVLASIITAIFGGVGGTPWIDAKRGGAPATMLQVGVGSLFCSFPVSLACYMAL